MNSFDQLYIDSSAAFTIDKPQAPARDTITFTNQSTDANSYHWDFGDDEAKLQSSC